MSRQKKLTPAEKSLTRRYLIWCYKTTKEAVDRIDRKFTQLRVDHHIWDLLSGSKEVRDRKKDKDYAGKISQFEQYIKEKAAGAAAEKFSDKDEKTLHPEYWYLKNRLAAVEKAICDFLGKKQLAIIRSLYEEEMIQRILSEREHR